ncbi:MAG: YbaY family lipoprotein, partial [Deltaproteobacteria bacterium]
RVRGSASLPSPDALPAGAVFEATIEDVSRADAPASVLGRTRIESPGRSPIAFEIAWEPQRMAPGARVGLRGRVVLGDRLLFTTTTFQPVPTPGDDLRADLQLESVPAPAPAATGQAGGEPGGATRPGL